MISTRSGFQNRKKMSKKYDPLKWYKDQICQMSWDEILELMDERIKNGSWDKFVESLGAPPHVIKHDYEMEKTK